MSKYIFIVLLVVILGCDNDSKSADIIIIIPSYTMNSDQPWAEAIAVKDNKIIFVGNKSEALNWLMIAAAQGHLKSSLWIELNIDYQKDKMRLFH